MILLTSTNDTLALTTADDNSPSGVSIDVQVSYVDLPIATQLQEPGRENTIITSVTTTTILGSPGTSVYRAVKDVSIYNSSLTNACEITIIHDDGTNAVTQYNATILPKTSVHYSEGEGFYKSAGLSGNVVNDTIWNNSGDLVVGTGENSATRLETTVDGYLLTADSAEPAGVKWAEPLSVSFDNIWQAKGDLLSGGSPGSAIRIPVGTDGYSLIADQFSTGGVRWADAAGAGTKQGDLEAAVKSSVTFQGLTFEAVTPGVDGNNITIQLIELQPVTGVVFQTTGTDILIKTQNAVTTVNQGDILTGFGSAPTDVTDLINLTITSSGTLLTGVQRTNTTNRRSWSINL